MTALDYSPIAWRKSSRSGNQGGACVEITFIDGKDAPVEHKHSDRMVVMRDSKNPEGPVLYFTEAEWDAFVGGVKDGEFDDMLEDD